MGKKSTPGAQPKEAGPANNQKISNDTSSDIITDETPGAQPKEAGPASGVDLLSNDGVNTIMTIGERTVGDNLVTATADVVMPASPEALHPGLLKVLIKYPEDWDKGKFMKDGDVKFCSQETADSFVNLGIGTIQKD